MADYPLSFGDACRVAEEMDKGNHGEYALFVDDTGSSRLSVVRIGTPGGGLAGRVGLISEERNRPLYTVGLYSAPECRAIAAALLDAADELDGATPLTFFGDGGETPAA